MNDSEGCVMSFCAMLALILGLVCGYGIGNADHVEFVKATFYEQGYITFDNEGIPLLNEDAPEEIKELFNALYGNK